jgi:deoxyribose-phosphate aldolase
MLSRDQLARMIDHTLLRPDATHDRVVDLCREAIAHSFAAVCVNSCWVPLAAAELAGAAIRVCSVVGFPLGATAPSAKIAEAEIAARDGARELDMVLNIGKLKDANFAAVESDIAGVVEVGRSHGALVKVILETALLTDAEKSAACKLARAAGAAFVKTSTGFGPGGATAADIALMRRAVGPEMGVKASGGIRTLDDALRMIEAGANRIGASAGVQILQGLA